MLICSAEIANKITQSPCSKGQFKGAVVSFCYPWASVFWGNLETNSVPRTRDPLVRVACELGSTRLELEIKSVKSQKTTWRHPVSLKFSWRHRSRVTFDLAKQSSVAAVKKHLTEFLGPWRSWLTDITLWGKEQCAVRPPKTEQELCGQRYIPVNLLVRRWYSMRIHKTIQGVQLGRI